MYTIVVANFKGGVGKTTITRNLGAMLAKMGKKVLLVDTDWQSTLTSSLNVKYYLDLEPGDNSVIVAESCLSKMLESLMITATNVSENLDLIPNERGLAEMAVKLSSKMSMASYTVLKKLLSKVEQDYDYCIIDTAPGQDIIHTNTFMAANGVIIPIQPAEASVAGTLVLCNKIKEIVEDGHNDLELLGVLINEYRPNLTILASVMKTLNEHELPVFEAKISDKQIFKNREAEKKDVLKELGYEFGKLAEEIILKTSK